ncbi:MAG: RNase H1/viroplasmin domain-containing protein, partial [Desulfobulbaceae bacterium]|nr:RNase H1/viroplasmin domain-containing protein [Desulfobulbaceae bacterium]
MATKKFYAIAKGRKPGIYDNWPEAQAQVMSFSGAVYKGFPTRQEGEAW